mmetsp:Transcript_6812/g.11485  ORF Transcript_6812/g.11485 Transcript_6812/m.11485 type:complete len:84 (-) Transcript_6812:1517-1768(-)
MLHKLEAKEIFLNEMQHESLQIDVYMNYQGQISNVHSHIFTYNEAQKDEMTWDNQEEKTGMSKACEIINEQITPLFDNRDLSA